MAFAERSVLKDCAKLYICLLNAFYNPHGTLKKYGQNGGKDANGTLKNYGDRLPKRLYLTK